MKEAKLTLKPRSVTKAGVLNHCVPKTGGREAMVGLTVRRGPISQHRAAWAMAVPSQLQGAAPRGCGREKGERYRKVGGGTSTGQSTFSFMA